MLRPMVVGYRRPLFWSEWWHMVDVDPAQRNGVPEVAPEARVRALPAKGG